jgi:gliding motility-associated-like protein
MTKHVLTLCAFLFLFGTGHAQQANPAKSFLQKANSNKQKSVNENASVSRNSAGTNKSEAKQAPQILHFGTNKQSSVAHVAWIQNAGTNRSLSFIENKGQFEKLTGTASPEIQFGVNDNSSRFFFTKKGLVYKILKSEHVSDKVWEEFAEKHHFKTAENESGSEEQKGHILIRESIVTMNWQGANPNPEIVAEDVLPNYFNYLDILEKDQSKALIGEAHGFRKITYKNIYPHIDIEYSIHPEDGIKYAYILHPGANPSAIKMAYSGTDIRLDGNNNIILPTAYGDFTDHAPLTYQGNVSSGNIVESSFYISGKNCIGFKLAPGHETITQTTTIDPWTNGPPTTPSQSADDVATDPSDNIVVYSTDTSGTNGSSLSKYNSAGTLQWTLSVITKYGYVAFNQGDVGADNTGNVYFTIGLGGTVAGYYNTCKLNPAGSALLWGRTTPAGSSNNLLESWSLSFNCSQNQLIQSGGGLNGGTTSYNVSTFETLNTANGAEGTLIEDDNLGEIISSFWAPNNLMYHLTADSNLNGQKFPPSPFVSAGNHGRLICDNPATGFSRVFNVKTGYHYTDGNSKAPGSVGLNSIATSCEFLYTTDGLALDKWDLLSGAHLGATTVPGGTNNYLNVNVNSGIICDQCGNVYVGSNKNIYVFDPSLTLVNTIGGLPDVVYDLSLSKNGQIIACGGSKTNKAFVAAVNNICSSATGGLSVAVTQPSCGTPSGSASATVSFCGAPYIYSWSDGSSTQTVSNLPPGNYTVNVSGSVTCPFTYSVTGTFTINPPVNTPSATNTPADVTCNGGCNGSITINPTGGVLPYTYSWFPSGGSGQIASGLCPNIYTCTITGNNGCFTTQTATINQPAVLAIAPAQANVKCNGGCTGTASPVVTGGVGPVTYVWSGAGYSGGGQGTATATGLCAGIYSVVVTDANSCPITVPAFVISQASPFSATSSASLTGCGSSTGTDTAKPAGGVPPYSYVWSGAGYAGGGQGSAIAKGLGQGSYLCTITDFNGCVQTTSATVNQANGPVTTQSSSNLQCNAACNGTAKIHVTGGTGTPPYTFSWVNTVSTLDSAINLCAGPPSYTCTVTDKNGCQSSQIFVITQPLALSVSPTTTIASCGLSNGTASANASGGKPGPGYTFVWSGLTYTGGGQGTNTATGLAAGAYTVLVSDSAGCSKQTVVTVTQPSLLSATGVATDATCQKPNGSATVTPAGGSGLVDTYSWSPSGGTGATASNLSPAIYTCVVTDSLGCKATVVDTIKNASLMPVSAIISGVPADTACSNAPAGTLSVSNPLPGTVYVWTPGGQTTNSIFTSTTTSTLYTLTATNSCGSAVSTVHIAVISIPNPTVLGGKAICPGSADTLIATGVPASNGPTQYSWSPAPGGSNPFIIVDTAGVWTVTASNQCGAATASATVTLHNITAHFRPNIYVGYAPQPVSFVDSSSATAVSWSWNFGDGSTATGQNPTHTFAGAGAFVVTETVTDINGCTATYKVSVDIKELPSWIDVPNVFTPNGDGANDDWRVRYQGITSFNCKIYDRWGVFMSELLEPGAGWDGRTSGGLLAVPGTYYYILKAKGDDGKSYEFNGFMMLIRN